MVHAGHSKDFNLQKKLCLEKLYKPDHSRKGNVDEPIISMIGYINNLKDYYTTSSCSGRIQLLTESDKKPDVKWLFVSHELVTEEDILKALSQDHLKDYAGDRVWLRQENMIIHVACRTLEDADKMLKIARDTGLRRSGMIADSNIMIVEICSTEKMDVPVAENGELLVPESYIRLITQIANKKFSKGRQRLLRLEKEIRENITE